MTDRTGSQTPNDAPDLPAEIVLAQADTTSELAPTGPLDPDEATSLPRDLVETDALEGAEVAASEDGAIDVAPLAAGERRIIEVPSGTVVRLDDGAFDPSLAVYAVDGNDLVVTLANGGVLILVDFFAPGDAPRQLAVLDADPTLASDLLARAEAAPVVEPEQVEPAAGPEPDAGVQSVGGGSDFRAYDQGSIGPGLDPLGPLGPTELGFGADFEQAGPIDFIAADDGNGEPGTAAPVITVRATVEATIGEQSGPSYNPATTPVLPLGADVLNPSDDGVDRSHLSYREWVETRGFPAVPDDKVNSVDQDNLTLDVDREVFIRFINEDSFSIDSLFVHELGPNGEIIGVRPVFDGVNKPGDPLGNAKETPFGTEVSIGTVAADTKLGFIVLNDGFRVNDFGEFEGGRFEVRNAQTGEIAKITDFPNGENPRIVHIADDGTETVLNGERSFTADASQGTPNNNRLNADGKGHFVSGWDDAEGILVIGAEETSVIPADRDFTDLVFGVRFGSPLEPVLVIKDPSLDAAITDTDSSELTAASLVLSGIPGDTLVLDSAVAAGTGITINRVSDTEIELSGNAPLAAYEQVISAVTISIDLDDPQPGNRVLDISVVDDQGNTGNTSTTIQIDDNLLAGTSGADDQDQFPSTSVTTPDADGRDVLSGRGGDDSIDPMSGDDFVDGGDGRDFIDERFIGSNTIAGGPQPDLIVLGPGSDVVRINGLADGQDTIRNFDASEGDRLDLRQLFRDVDVPDADIGTFVQAVASGSAVGVQVDLDGAGSDHRFVEVARLENPTGVAAGTDPSTFVITADEQAVA